VRQRPPWCAALTAVHTSADAASTGSCHQILEFIPVALSFSAPYPRRTRRTSDVDPRSSDADSRLAAASSSALGRGLRHLRAREFRRGVGREIHVSRKRPAKSLTDLLVLLCVETGWSDCSASRAKSTGTWTKWHATRDQRAHPFDTEVTSAVFDREHRPWWSPPRQGSRCA